MKLKLIPLSLLPFSAVILTELSGGISMAFAQCVMTDVAVQTAIRGSRRPATQTNNVQMRADKSCFGNTSTSTSSQTYVGSDDRVIQQRSSVHDLSGSGNRRGIKGSNIAVPVYVNVDVYSPAHDPRFMNNINKMRSR
ncbi:hypothetical protein [Pseudanabaena sp. PCC 6802]|uniref:hypothetical protein n=1 Tax=Pseudanabaena sp. PCC 6802 TaxID=118173 RepID=UPI00034CA4F2|nr:hypothetical protein [Pseudanabaena sp. PCC 6802]